MLGRSLGCLSLTGLLVLSTPNLRTWAAPGPTLNTSRVDAEALSAPALWTLDRIEDVARWKARRLAPIKRYRQAHPLLDDFLSILSYMCLGFGMIATVEIEWRADPDYQKCARQAQVIIDTLDTHRTETLNELRQLLYGPHGLTGIHLLPYYVALTPGTWDDKMRVADYLITTFDDTTLYASRTHFLLKLHAYKSRADLGVAIIQLRKAERLPTTEVRQWMPLIMRAIATLPTADQLKDLPRAGELLAVHAEVDTRLKARNARIEEFHREQNANRSKPPEAVTVVRSPQEVATAQWMAFQSGKNTRADHVEKFFEGSDWRRNRDLDSMERLTLLGNWLKDWWEGNQLKPTTWHATLLKLLLDEIIKTLNLRSLDSLFPANLPVLVFLGAVLPAWLKNPSPEYSRMNALYKLQQPSPLRRLVETLAKDFPQWRRRVLRRRSNEIDERMLDLEFAIAENRALDANELDAVDQALRAFIEDIPAAFAAEFSKDVATMTGSLEALQEHHTRPITTAA